MNSELGNVGHTFIDSQTAGSIDSSMTMTFNEIAHLISFKEAIMKIDIESYECIALQAADELFDKVTIYEVYMELNFGITGAAKFLKYCVDSMLNFFARQNYAVYNMQGQPYDNQTMMTLIFNLLAGITEVIDVVWKLKPK